MSTYEGRIAVFTGNIGNIYGWRIVIGEDAASNFSTAWRKVFRGFKTGTGPDGTAVYVPFWFPVLLMGVFAAVPWIKWRFSVRTMLIGTAVIAGLLALLAAASR